MDYFSAFGTADGLDWDGAHILEKTHCKKLNQKQGFQLGYYMQRNNRAIPQHRVRYIQIILGVLRVLQYVECIREIIDGPIQWMGTRKSIFIIQDNSTSLNR